MLRDPIFITDQCYNEEFNPEYAKHMLLLNLRYNTWAYIFCLMGH